MDRPSAAISPTRVSTGNEPAAHQVEDREQAVAPPAGDEVRGVLALLDEFHVGPYCSLTSRTASPTVITTPERW